MEIRCKDCGELIGIKQDAAFGCDYGQCVLCEKKEESEKIRRYNLTVIDMVNGILQKHNLSDAFKRGLE